MRYKSARQRLGRCTVLWDRMQALEIRCGKAKLDGKDTSDLEMELEEVSAERAAIVAEIMNIGNSKLREALVGRYVLGRTLSREMATTGKSYWKCATAVSKGVEVYAIKYGYADEPEGGAA